MLMLPSFSARALCALTGIILCASALGTTIDKSKRPTVAPPPPDPIREFRAAWIASVGNINWPSKPGLPVAQQKTELIALFDHAARLKLNAIVLQVRPACDALYSSHLEPWSEYLSDTMGQPPSPLYDPLAFAIQQAHLRGLQLHAWFNPFRARHENAKSPVSSRHISRTHPSIVRRYGNFLWLDPGEKIAQEHSTAVILDVVRRYDVDGIHLDDYFYPYKEKDDGRFIDFPDEPSWKRYQASGGKLNRSNWRRQNIDRFVQNLYSRIKSEKRSVKFGISPFGIWRPGSPPNAKGLDAYEDLFADSRRWLREGWLDYFCPQLYWAIDAPHQSFPMLLAWWTEQNPHRRHLWPGLAANKIGSSQWPVSEITQQVRLTRQTRGTSGHIFWNIATLAENQGGFASQLTNDLYSQPALPPAFPWLDSTPPPKPSLRIQRFQPSRDVKISWESPNRELPSLWLIQTRLQNKWTTEIRPPQIQSRSFPGSNSIPFSLAVRAVDRSGNLSLPTLISFP